MIMLCLYFIYLTHVLIGIPGLGWRCCRSSHYIDYRKIRGLLNRAKASAELCDELIRRMPPDVVVEVARRQEDRLAGSPLAFVERNSEDLSTSLKTGDYSIGVINKDESDSVSTPLLRKNLSRHINQTIRHVTNYLGLADDREVLLEAYVVVDDQLRSFEQTYEKEVCSQIFTKGTKNDILCVITFTCFLRTNRS